MATHSIFLPGKFHGQRSPAGYSPRGHKVRYYWETNTLLQESREWILGDNESFPAQTVNGGNRCGTVDKEKAVGHLKNKALAFSSYMEEKMYSILSQAIGRILSCVFYEGNQTHYCPPEGSCINPLGPISSFVKWGDKTDISGLLWELNVVLVCTDFINSKMEVKYKLLWLYNHKIKICCFWWSVREASILRNRALGGKVVCSFLVGSMN